MESLGILTKSIRDPCESLGTPWEPLRIPKEPRRNLKESLRIPKESRRHLKESRRNSSGYADSFDVDEIVGVSLSVSLSSKSDKSGQLSCA